MDSSKKFVKPSPEDNANICNKLFYCWVLPFIKFGYKNDLRIKDVYNTTKTDFSGSLGDELERYWNEEVAKYTKGTNKKPSLQRAILKTFFKSYSFYGVWLFLQCVILRMLQPIILAEYISYFDAVNKDKGPTEGWLLGSGVVLIAFFNVLIMHYCSLGCQREGMRVRIACCSLMYRKLLKLSQTSLGQTAAGQLVNLMSNDVQRFDLAANFLHYAWIMPIQAVLAFYVMYRSVGLAAIAGMLAITIQAIPLQGYLSKLQGKLRYKIALRTDHRVKLMSEITSGIQVIKMYAWEKPFEKVVELARKLEIDVIMKTSYIRGVSVATMVFTERVTLYLTLITFVLSGETLTGNVVFSMAQLFNTVQLYMCIFFPMSISTYAEARVSIKRLENFLTMEENPEKKRDPDEKAIATGSGGEIRITKANATWLPNPIVYTLMNINLDIKPGTLCCVVGSVGAGKSSLLQMLLKELPLTTGRLEITGTLSYASQQPWLFVSSIRNNILFGKPYLKNRYKDIVRVCALQRDFEQFPQRDQTLVGERGVSLSGGQRARINLARAVYNEADIYLLDDPLSAVDTHVGKHLFEQCIKRYLNRKTRILVTHQLQFMREADLIILLNNGRIEKICKFSELSESELKNLNQESHHEEKEREKSPTIEIRDRVNSYDQRDRLQSIASFGSSLLNEEPQEIEEQMETGAIPASTYAEYWRSGGNYFVLGFLAFLLIMAQMAVNASDMWLTHWTNVVEENTRLSLNRTIEKSMDTPPKLPVLKIINSTLNDSSLLNPTTMSNLSDSDYYIIIYSVFILLSIILTTFRSLLYYKICMTASKVLHNKMFANILQAPMRFFDTNPSGRILNRFSKDMGSLDELLPRALLDAIQIFLVMSGILVMNFIVTPWMIIPAILLGGLFYYFRVIYLSTAQDVKRLEGVTRAPVFSHVSASLYGMPTIRASNAEEMVIKEFDTLQDQHTSTWFSFLASSEAFGFYLDIISTTFLALVTYQFLILKTENTLSGNVGLVISQSLILTGMLQFGVRQTAEVASNMISVERILQYTKLDKEGPFESTKKPPKDWPSAGDVKFKKTYLKYGSGEPYVLKNLNLEIKPSEKVGIVGRTGAGKSSMIASLFRLTPIEGIIEVDNVDTSTVGLTDLRSNISIIPQEPILFSASVRYNLDPFEKHSDETLWKALENVELKGAIDNTNQQVSEGGSNFSAGQRQLICLARAIVRNNKILVMDEATANVDPNTDALIQKTIRSAFKNCTVLTIAHRLNTIMDSDKVLVMDNGQAVEFAHPHELLQNPDGHFSKMVRETGNLADKLKRIAREDYEKKFPKDETEEIRSEKKQEENQVRRDEQRQEVNRSEQD